ncbi:MAG: hypothetical protein ACI32B_03650 [Erysipelotrichaceae bacterium]
MKYVKKIFMFFIASSMMFSLIACSSNTNGNGEKENDKKKLQ